jgi:hypothetical protein
MPVRHEQSAQSAEQERVLMQRIAITAADFFVVVTATFRIVYLLLIMEIETRRILHVNVTRHSTEWTR